MGDMCMDDNEELAIIKDVGFGLRDGETPILWFEADMKGSGALLAFWDEDALKFVKDNNVIDIKHLNGKPCIVSVDRGLVKFVRIFKA